jgi:uncharacterized protein (TIGR03067 family)
MRRFLLTGLVSLSLVAADTPESDMGRLEGRWYGGVWSCNGDWALVVDLKDPVQVLDIAENTATLRTRKSGSPKRWSYTAMPNRAPKAIDLTDETGTQRGIYKIERNRYGGYYLSLCVAEPGAGRPERFEHAPKGGGRLYSFARYPLAR